MQVISHWNLYTAFIHSVVFPSLPHKYGGYKNYIVHRIMHHKRVLFTRDNETVTWISPRGSLIKWRPMYYNLLLYTHPTFCDPFIHCFYYNYLLGVRRIRKIRTREHFLLHIIKNFRILSYMQHEITNSYVKNFKRIFITLMKVYHKLFSIIIPQHKFSWNYPYILIYFIILNLFMYKSSVYNVKVIKSIWISCMWHQSFFRWENENIFSLINTFF